MLGEHCYACGQPAKGLVRHFGSLLGDFTDSVFDLDSRLLRTLGPLLWRPGFLTREYFAGHWVRYVSPVRLFVFLCVIAFFALRWTVDPQIDAAGADAIDQAQSAAEVSTARDAALAKLAATAENAAEASDAEGLAGARAQLKRRAQHRIDWLAARDTALSRGEPPPPEPGAGNVSFNGRPWHPQTNPIQLDWLSEASNQQLNAWTGRTQTNLARVRNEPRLLVEAILQSLPTTFFVLLPLFALLLKLAYLRQRRLYMEHLIVALHSHAFLCIALLVLVGLSVLRGLVDAGGGLHAALGWAEVAVAAWMPLYLWLMQKRVYAQGVILTSLKYVALGTCYLLLVTLGVAANLLANLVTL